MNEPQSPPAVADALSKVPEMQSPGAVLGDYLDKTVAIFQVDLFNSRSANPRTLAKVADTGCAQ